MVGGPQSWFGCFGEEKQLLALSGVKSQFLGLPTHGAVIIPCALPCLPQAVIHLLKVYDAILLALEAQFQPHSSSYLADLTYSINLKLNCVQMCK